ncbi:MAG: hypothetical protein P4L51_10670 [Puia sp.]|nr:hypothetical protein [Puia sp.]
MKKKVEDKMVKIVFGVAPAEKQKLVTAYKNSNCDSFSQFIYRWVFRKPITTLHRNLSMDLFTEEIIQYKEAILAIAEQKSPDDQAQILENLRGIQNTINKILSLWSPTSTSPTGSAAS